MHPKREEYNNQHLYEMNSMLPKLMEETEGGSLVLCTSRLYVAEVAKSLKKSKRIKNTVFSQSNGDTQNIGENFTKDINSILVGSGSFFTGFSVEGDSLNKLFLSKLPFPVPTDAYIELISQGYSDRERYIKIIVPMMLKKLEQGMGRLIRSKTDTGIITIFDTRVAPGTAPYKFIKSLGYTITSDLSEVRRFTKNLQSNKIVTSNGQFSEQLLKIPKIEEQEKKSSKKNKKGSENKKMRKTVTSKRKTSGKIRIKSIYSFPRVQNWLVDFVETHQSDTDKVAKKIEYNKLKTPADVYQKALDYCYQKGIDYHLVLESFPFQDEYQKRNFEEKKPKSEGSFRPDWF